LWSTQTAVGLSRQSTPCRFVLAKRHVISSVDTAALLKLVKEPWLAVMLYGSHAREDALPDSEVDLLPLADEAVDHYQLGPMSVMSIRLSSSAVCAIRARSSPCTSSPRAKPLPTLPAKLGDTRLQDIGHASHMTCDFTTLWASRSETQRADMIRSVHAPVEAEGPKFMAAHLTPDAQDLVLTVALPASL
jgi:hypothetical protein